MGCQGRLRVLEDVDGLEHELYAETCSASRTSIGHGQLCTTKCCVGPPNAATNPDGTTRRNESNDGIGTEVGCLSTEWVSRIVRQGQGEERKEECQEQSQGEEE